ncbi:unnamed protein product [Musa acuminata var. zebrina]
MYGLAELQVEGDENCQFRALADQLFHNADYHKHVSKAVLKHLKKHYEGCVPMESKKYLKIMKRSLDPTNSCRPSNFELNCSFSAS